MSRGDEARAGVCLEHSHIAESLGEMTGLLRAHEKRWDETQKTLTAIFDQLRRSNGIGAEQGKDIAILEEKAKHAVVSEARLWSVGITAAGLFLREGVKRVFGF